MSLSMDSWVYPCILDLPLVFIPSAQNQSQILKLFHEEINNKKNKNYGFNFLCIAVPPFDVSGLVILWTIELVLCNLVYYFGPQEIKIWEGDLLILNISSLSMQIFGFFFLYLVVFKKQIFKGIMPTSTTHAKLNHDPPSDSCSCGYSQKKEGISLILCIINKFVSKFELNSGISFSNSFPTNFKSQLLIWYFLSLLFYHKNKNLKLLYLTFLHVQSFIKWKLRSIGMQDQNNPFFTIFLIKINYSNAKKILLKLSIFLPISITLASILKLVLRALGFAMRQGEISSSIYILKSSSIREGNPDFIPVVGCLKTGKVAQSSRLLEVTTGVISTGNKTTQSCCGLFLNIGGEYWGIKLEDPWNYFSSVGTHKSSWDAI
ncbi:hypothetical protein VP01_2843g1 [Puccinia sorghi]|uniref:Uncharacterized protein n=1 Tax=Puccinia sorghi TaxID=27349 RepID=A0A0L6V233_9BASI|nr:hypothetical protein VP01_2843g1 [Puccinia sorghi]